MEEENEENDVVPVGDALLKLIGNIKDLEHYIENGFFNKSTSPSFKELLVECNISLVNSFIEVKKFKGFRIQEELYDFGNRYNFKNSVGKGISYESFLNKIRSIKIKALYHVLKLNMFRLDLCRHKTNLKNRDIDNFLRCDYFMAAFLGYFRCLDINMEDLLPKNNVGNNIKEWSSFLDDFFSKHEKNINRRSLAFLPSPMHM